MLRRLIRAGDRWLSRRQGIVSLSDDPRCVFRTRLIRARATLQFPGCTIPAGTPLLELHTCNERMPELPVAGAALDWATAGRGRLRATMHLLAEQVANESALQDVAGVVGFTALFADGGKSGAERILHRLGFETAPLHHRRRPFREFWLNFHAWMIMWAYNRGSVRRRRLLRLRHSMLWISRADLLERWLVPVDQQAPTPEGNAACSTSRP